MTSSSSSVLQPGPTMGVWTDARPEPGTTEGRRRYAELLEEARLADALGYHTFATTEQHGVDDGYLPAQLTLIAGLATATTRIRFMTNALLLLLHPWRQVVEQAIIADLLSNGRLSLGVAVGNYQREFDLFGVDMSKRAELMEQALVHLRSGLADGQMPDGPDGAMVPALPRPAQARVPIYVGGLANRVMDRAARLGDGIVPVDFFHPEEEFPKIWENKVQPAMERHGRTLDDFRFTAVTHLWASDDPERDWHTFLRSALEYQFRKYAEWAGDWSEIGAPIDQDFLDNWRHMFIDTPENIAQRLIALRERAPFHEVLFWYRIPHFGHERSMEHLERVAKRVMPLLAAAGTTAATS